MAQNGPHGHQVDAAASDDGHRAPPTTVAFSLTSAGPYGNAGSSAGNMENLDASASKGKNLIPDLNMEERDDSAGGSKDKPRSEAELVVPAADADADAGADKGKSVAAADDGEPTVNIALEPEKRKRMKDLFRELRDLMPHVPRKTDKVALMGEAIKYIRALEEKAAMLGKQVLARPPPAAARGEASSSSSSSLTAAMMPDVPRGWGGVPAVPPAGPAVPASPPLRCNTWTWPNVALTVANENACISVCVPRRANNTLSMLMSVLDNHGIDVITSQISSDRARDMFMIYGHVTGIGGENRRSAEEVYQRAVSEIKCRLNNSNT
ncbi:transcription factor bHLH95 [Sorghum bicolor]|uniref:BHLH domain-containing protein n=1 Tax=Sorghum bicolor TaxID=4558 RepID=A0A1Z5RMY2_SORBI|nr:transcription factor bHLH95 [Sorghum bicolor]OQU85093.1 hypothetical protein SORBI_3004G171600 [Sorghum bicolor]|eukprot:XP_002452243.1 transcription factor bHLH95 [Sorghum bicolor]